MKKLWISLSACCCLFILSGFTTTSSNIETSFIGCTQTVRGCDTNGDGQPDIFYSLLGGPAPLPSSFNPALYTVPAFGCANITFSITCPPPPPPPPPGGGTTIQVEACDVTGEGQPDVFYSLSGGPAPLPSDFNPALYTVPPGGCDIISIVI